MIGALRAYNNKEPPTTINKKAKIKSPRSGSLAKACTDTNIPERTKNVPSKLREKASKASKIVQLLNTPRFSVADNE